MRAGVSIVIPTLNEAENIEGIISRILAQTGALSAEIIVVDDNSKDDTQAIVRRLEMTQPVRLLARAKPQDGLAGAVLAGARAAQEEVVLIIDADGSHPPEQIPALALPVIQGEREMVIGSRYMPGGSTPGWSRKRRLMSRAASACAWPLTDVHDALSGFFAVRRDLLTSIPSDAAGFKIALEILVRGGDSIRVGEVPIAFRDRELGQSKMGSGVIFTYFRRLLALSGWRESQDTVRLAMAKTLLVWCAHWLVFAAAWELRTGLGLSNLLGFVAGAVLNIYFKRRQLGAASGREKNFIGRLLVVSLLSFFLRSGVLAVLAKAFGWPALAAILPAIVTGWAVMFAGYALFIWPVRSQYGSGIRWRVAGLGATIYLLALRVVYLYAAPLNHRMAELWSGAVTPSGPMDRGTLAVLHPIVALLGASPGAFNLPALVCWPVMAWFVFQTTRNLFDKTAAFRAVLLLSLIPPYFLAGVAFYRESMPLVLWAALLWLIALLLGPRGRAPIVLFFLAGLGAVLWLPLYAPTLPHLLLALGAIGLPLVPLMASRMGRRGHEPPAWWSPDIYFSILCYGAVLYWLAYHS